MTPPPLPPFLSPPDPETDEDEELTYENVQVPSVSGGLASSGVGDKAGTESPEDVCLTGWGVHVVCSVCVLSWESTVLLSVVGGWHNISGKGGGAQEREE